VVKSLRRSSFFDKIDDGKRSKEETECAASIAAPLDSKENSLKI